MASAAPSSAPACSEPSVGAAGGLSPKVDVCTDLAVRPEPASCAGNTFDLHSWQPYNSIILPVA